MDDKKNKKISFSEWPLSPYRTCTTVTSHVSDRQDVKNRNSAFGAVFDV